MLGDVPLTLSVVLRASWNYDEEGCPWSADLVQKFANQKDYIAAVRLEENRNLGNSYRLSEALEDFQRRQLRTAMRLYQNGKVEWYAKLIDGFPQLAVRNTIPNLTSHRQLDWRLQMQIRLDSINSRCYIQAQLTSRQGEVGAQQSQIYVHLPCPQNCG